MALGGNRFSPAAQVRLSELKEIESKLHPIISIDGKAIIHRHVASVIIFSAYLEITPFNNREYSVSRNTVLLTKDFYKEHLDQLEWLVEVGKLEYKLEIKEHK